MTTLKDMFARGLAVVAIVIAIIGIFTPVGHMAAGQILDTFSGDYFNATHSFQINGVNVFGTDSSSVNYPSNITSQKINGVTEYFLRGVFNPATTTPCVLPLPAATTTLQTYSFNITTGTSSAGSFVMGTSTTPYSTSTTPILSAFSVPAGGQATAMADPTSNGVLSPSLNLVLGMTNGSAVSYGYTYTGTCSAVVDGVI